MFATEKFANGAQSTLLSSISSSGTVLGVASVAGFPGSGNFRILVDEEVMLCTSIAGELLTVTRGMEGTAAVAHVGGATVTCIITTNSLKNNPLALTAAFDRPFLDGDGNQARMAIETVDRSIDTENKKRIAQVERGEVAQSSPSIVFTSYSTGNIGLIKPLLIQGRGFLSTKSVTFGGTPARYFKVISDSQIRCQPFPATAAGSAPIVITNAANPGMDAATATTPFTFTKPSLNLASKTEYLRSNNPGIGASILLRQAHDSDLVFVDANSSGLGVWWKTSKTGTAVRVSGTGLPLAFPTISHNLASLLVTTNGGYTCAEHHGGYYHIKQYGDRGEFVITPNQLVLEQPYPNPDFQASIVAPDGNEFLMGGTFADQAGPYRGWIWRCDPVTGLDPELVIIDGCTFGPFAIVIPGGLILTFDPKFKKFLTVDTSCNVTQLDGIPNIVTIYSGFIDGNGDVVCVGSNASFAYFFIKFSLSNIAGATVIPLPAGAAFANNCCYGPDGLYYFIGANFATNTDSVLYQYSTSMTLLNTVTLTGSSSSNSNPGFARDVCNGDDNNIWVIVGVEQGASHNGSLWKIGGN